MTKCNIKHPQQKYPLSTVSNRLMGLIMFMCQELKMPGVGQQSSNCKIMGKVIGLQGPIALIRIFQSGLFLTRSKFNAGPDELQSCN